MDTLIQDRSDGAADAPIGGDGRLPPRPRQRLLTPPTVALLALATCAIGFYAGVRVEKSHAGSSSSSPAAAFSAAASAGAGTGGSGSTGAGRSGYAGLAVRFGGAGGPGGAAGPGGGSAGTVASVDGRWLVLKETSGNTVKVKLTSATKITKSKSVGHGQIRPGDTIVVSGVTGQQGAISAASVSDSGAATSGASSSASGGSSSAGSGSSGSAVSSLFSGR